MVIEYDPIQLGPREFRLRWMSTLGAGQTYKIYKNGDLYDTTTAETYDVFCDTDITTQWDIRDDSVVPDVTHEKTARIWWYGVTGASYYTVQQQKNGGGYSTIATVQENGQSRYRVQTAALDAQATYEWKITAVDVNGNSTAAPIQLTKYTSRTPDQPDWTGTYDAETGELTITV